KHKWVCGLTTGKQISCSCRKTEKRRSKSNRMSRNSFDARAIPHQTNLFRRGERRRLIGAKKDTWVICLIIMRRLYLLRVGQNLFLSLDPGRRRGNYENISINIISAD